MAGTIQTCEKCEIDTFNLPPPSRWLTEFRMKYLPSLKIRTNYSQNELSCHQCQKKKTEKKRRDALMVVYLGQSNNDSIIRLAKQMTSNTYCKDCCDVGDETKTKWIIHYPLPEILIKKWIMTKIISMFF